MSDRWDRERVLGLAPDGGSAKAAAGIARTASWARTGHATGPAAAGAVWGECQGSGTSVYRTCVDLSEPAFRCTCPSRKFPCKHALGLLLLWSDGTIAAADLPGWVDAWLAGRRERAERRPAGSGTGQAASAGSRTAERRERRVDDGVEELDRWLRDQIAHGLASAGKAPYHLWDDAARRLVDAQAPALAGQVRALASRVREPGWPDRLLEEYALLRLLATAHRRRAELPEPLRATVRSRIGFTVGQDEVLHGPTDGTDGTDAGRGAGARRVRDQWYVAGSRDSEQDRLITRRVWLRGRRTGRPALILSFAAPGRALDTSLLVGDTIDAELAFYPGAQPLRALVAERHGAPFRAVPAGTSVQGLLREYAEALSRDPWLDRWPAVLTEVRPARAPGRGWYLVDQAGDALPLRGTDPWRLLALSGGRPVTAAGEWTPYGLWPLSAWHDEEGIVVL